MTTLAFVPRGFRLRRFLPGSPGGAPEWRRNAGGTRCESLEGRLLLSASALSLAPAVGAAEAATLDELYGTFAGTSTSMMSPAPISISRTGTTLYNPGSDFFNPDSLSVTFSPSSAFDFGSAIASQSEPSGLTPLPVVQTAASVNGNTISWTTESRLALTNGSFVSLGRTQSVATLQNDGAGQLVLTGTMTTTPLVQALPANLAASFSFVEFSNTTFTLRAPAPVVPAAPPPGGADPAFDGGNAVGFGFAAQSSFIAPDGRTLVAGFEPTSGAGGARGVLARLGGDGVLDGNFGSGGTVADSATADEAFYAVTTEADGTIIAAGTSGGDLLLAAYNANGSVDSTFGTGGRVTVPVAGVPDAAAYGLTVDPNGDLVAVGSAGGQFLADRFTANGTADPLFNGGAPLQFGPAGPGNVLGAVALQANAIVAAGASGGNAVVVRIDPAGAADSTFGTGGVVTVSGLAAPDLTAGQPDHTEGLAVDPQGRILVANRTAAASNDFGLVRLTSAGAADASFGSNGLVTTDFGGADDADFVAVQPDGSQILVAGTSTVSSTAQEVVAAYLPDGSVDTAFGTAGKVLLGTGLASPALARSPDPGPQAVGIGEIVEQVFGQLEGGRLLLGASQTGGVSGSANLRRLIAPSPAVTPTPAPTVLPAGTLGAMVSAGVPRSVIAGGKATGSASVTVSNPTGRTVSGSVTVMLFVSLERSFDGATPLPGTAKTLHLTIKPGKSKVLKLKLSSFPAVAAGAYYVIAQVKAPDGSPTGAAGPTLTISPAFVSVVASTVRPQAGAVAAGGSAALTFTVQSKGNEPVTGTAPLTVALSAPAAGAAGPALDATPVRVKLQPNGSKVYKARFKVPSGTAAGDYLLTLALGVRSLGDATAADGIAVSGATLTVK